jgi:signal recognition particle GTPase
MRAKPIACMQCMSEEERQKPDLLVKSAKRKRQLARDSGRTAAEVNDLLTTFTEMRVRMKTMSKMMAQSGGMGARSLPFPPSATLQ